MFSTTRTGSILCLSLLAAANLALADEVTATPYRPTVSDPAEMSAPGWLEVEGGVARSKGSDNSWQNNQPYTLKYAFTEDFGVMLTGDFRVSQVDASGQKTAGRGDNILLLKHRFGATDDHAFGVEWGVKFANGATGISSGAQDYIFNGIYSVDIGKVRVDSNLGVTRLGLKEDGLGPQQYNWAVAVSREVFPQWTLAGELSGTSRHGMSATDQFLVAASYAVSNKVVVDFGAAAGYQPDCAGWDGVCRGDLAGE